LRSSVLVTQRPSMKERRRSFFIALDSSILPGFPDNDAAKRPRPVRGQALISQSPLTGRIRRVQPLVINPLLFLLFLQQNGLVCVPRRKDSPLRPDVSAAVPLPFQRVQQRFPLLAFMIASPTLMTAPDPFF
jgi:hypothetical protein